MLLYTNNNPVGTCAAIYIGSVTMGTGLWNITLRDINQYNSSFFWANFSQSNHIGMCYTDNTNTSLMLAATNCYSAVGYLSYYKYNITGPASYWVNLPTTQIPNYTFLFSWNASPIDICLDTTNQGLINVWINDVSSNMYIPINTWATKSIPETSLQIEGNSALFGGTATYNGLTTYNAQANFNNPVKHSFTYNNNFQVMTVTGQINTNVNHVISIGAITLTLPNATNAKIGQIIHIHLGPNTVTGQNPTIIIPANSGMKMCIGQNTGGVISYTFVSTNTEISLKLLYIGSYNASATLYWIAV